MGLGLVKRFLERGNSVIATTRNPADAPLLHTLLKEQPELGRHTMPRLGISKLDTADVSSIKSWAAELKAQVPHVDVRFAQFWWLGKSGCALHCPEAAPWLDWKALHFMRKPLAGGGEQRRHVWASPATG